MELGTWKWASRFNTHRLTALRGSVQPAWFEFNERSPGSRHRFIFVIRYAVPWQVKRLQVHVAIAR